MATWSISRGFILPTHTRLKLLRGDTELSKFHTNMKNSLAVRKTTRWNRLPTEAVESPVEIFRPRLDAYLCDCREPALARVGLDDLQTSPATPADAFSSTPPALPRTVPQNVSAAPAPRWQPFPLRPPGRGQLPAPSPRPATDGTRVTGRRAPALAPSRRRRMSGSTGDRARARGGRGCSGARGAGTARGRGGVPVPLPLPAAPAGPSRVSRPDSAAGTGEPALRRGCAGDGPRAGDGAVCVAPRCRGRGVSPARPGAAAAGLRGGRAVGRCGGPAGVGRRRPPRRECRVPGGRNRSPAVYGLRRALRPEGPLTARRWPTPRARDPEPSWGGLCRSQSAVRAKRALGEEGGRPLLALGSSPNFGRLNWSMADIDVFDRRYAVESLLMLGRRLPHVQNFGKTAVGTELRLTAGVSGSRTGHGVQLPAASALRRVRRCCRAALSWGRRTWLCVADTRYLPRAPEKLRAAPFRSSLPAPEGVCCFGLTLVLRRNSRALKQFVFWANNFLELLSER